MTAIWYECEECIFGTNSSKLAKIHEEGVGHTVFETADEVEIQP